MRTLGLALLGLLLAAAPASAATYTVSGTGDPVSATCNGATCDSLRAAVSRANQDQAADTISLPAQATYTLTQATQLSIGTNVGIVGAAGRQTLILAAGGTRAFAVNPCANLTLSRLTVTGGTMTQGTGGDILNQGTLTLDHARVTGGTAPTGGGGVANVGGTMTAVNSLIDGNTASSVRAQGGGILNVQGSGTTVIPSRLTLIDTTVANNRLTGDAIGAGIATVGGAAQTSLTSVTVARNTAGNASIGAAGLYQDTSGTVQVTASIVADNTGGGTMLDCGGQALPTAAGQNLATSACGFSTTADPLLDAALSDQGGQTNVLAIPPTSPAKRLVAVCPVASDQRDAPRQAGGVCDAGAYEQITPPPPPPQPTVSPSPTPTATPAPPPSPVFHKSVVVRPVSGTVRIKLPGTKKFVDLSVAQGVPLGSTIDVRHGRIALTSVPKAGGAPQTALFYGGIFKITQPGATTQLQLTERLAACRRHRTAAAAAATKRPRKRRLWGDGHGTFRTKGQYSAATVRGTKWFVQDSCAGTLTKVARGVVSVRDNVRHKTITLRAGKHYLARPKRS